MRVVETADLPPHKCFVCGSNQDDIWVDCDQDFWPQGVTDRDGRIYLCGTCVEISARQIGYVPEQDEEDYSNALKDFATLVRTLRNEQEDQWETVLRLAPFEQVPQAPRKLPEVVTIDVEEDPKGPSSGDATTAKQRVSSADRKAVGTDL